MNSPIYPKILESALSSSPVHTRRLVPTISRRKLSDFDLMVNMVGWLTTCPELWYSSSWQKFTLVERYSRIHMTYLKNYLHYDDEILQGQSLDQFLEITDRLKRNIPTPFLSGLSHAGVLREISTSFGVSTSYRRHRYVLQTETTEQPAVGRE